MSFLDDKNKLHQGRKVVLFQYSFQERDRKVL